MYEEKRFYNKRVNWLSVFLKLLLLVLVAFLVWFVIYKHRNKNTKPKDAKPMSENLTTLKTDYVKYFNEDNIPKSVNDEVKVPLEVLYDETKINTVYDKNGKECSPASSYGQMTKLDNNVYKLKVYLKCKNEADSIITTLTKDEIIAAKFDEKEAKKDTKKTDTKKDDTKKTTDNKNTKDTNKTTTDTKKTTDTNKTTDTKKTTDTNKTTNNNTNTTNKNNTNSTTNTNKTNTTNTTNTNKTNTTKTSTSTNTSTSNVATTTTTTTTQQPTTTTTTTTTTTKPTVEEIISDPSRIVSTEYRMIKYGEKTYTKPYGKYVSRTEDIKYYKYCINDDMYNCPKNIAKIPENQNIINTLLQLGYKEYEYKTETVIVYIPILDETWSDDKNLAGYTYTGESRTHYRMD